MHGWFSNIETDFGRLLPGLARGRRVIAVEQQGHGRTADVDRPFSYEQMADDTAALLRHLGIGPADVFGYSMGSGIAIELALRHPALVRKLVLAGGTSYAPDGLHPELQAGTEGVTPEALAGMLMASPYGQAYARLAPRPEDFPTLVAKKMEADRRWTGWPAEVVRGIAAPALLVIGDADIVRPEHTVEMFRLLGGGVPGDFGPLPRSQFAVLPGTAHSAVTFRADLLLPIVTPFLDAPLPEGQ
jgi:pimeloyl-ACP methyl ester carboxylesterase